MAWIKDLSRIVHDLIFDDASQSLCARAYEKQGQSKFWRLWVRCFGETHCKRSYDHWRNP